MLSFVVVCEAAADFAIASSLVDRRLLQCISWLEPLHLGNSRHWESGRAGKSFISWIDIPEIASQLRIRVHGHFDNAPGEPDAVAARRALLVIRHQIPHADAVVLIRDSDNDGRRQVGLEQGRKALHAPPVVVIGLACCKREAWVLSGFECQNEDELQALQEVRQELGFCPCSNSHELTAQAPQHKRSAKRVLKVLTHSNFNREARCWLETSMDVLLGRGVENGLTRFLDEVQERIVPLMS